MWKMKHRLLAEAEEAEGSVAPVSEHADSSPSLWDDLLDEPGVDEAGPVEAEPEVVAEEVGSEAEPEPEPTVTAAAEPPPAPTPAPVETLPEQAPPVAAEVSTPPQAQQPAPAQQPQPTAEQLQEWRQQALAALEQAYVLSADDASALQVEPEKVLPKMAANLHMQIYSQVMRDIAQSAPAFIQQTFAQQTAAQRAEEAFYAKWGNLSNHRDEVNRVAAMWRQMYPNASLEEAIDGVGQATAAMLGLAPAPAAVAATVPPPPPQPAGPSSRTAAPRARTSNLSPEAAQFVSFADEIMNEEL